MTARVEERARLRNALEVCRREAENIEYWNASRLSCKERRLANACRDRAAAAAIHAERAARAYFKGR